MAHIRLRMNQGGLVMANNEMDQETINQMWQESLTVENSSHYFGPFSLAGYRKLMKIMPKNPRCKVCYAPFSGMGGKIVKLAFGKEPSTHNPNICNICEQFAREHQGGAEVEISMLFADVRGSTTLAEGMTPIEFSRLIDRFYRTTTDILISNNAWIEKLIGDEVTGLFIPAFAGPQHARTAVKAAQAILKATGHGRPESPWIPVGVGVHTGIAYVGAVGKEGSMIEITALGDAVNTAARLATKAGPGEILVSKDTWNAAGLKIEDTETQQLLLKGRAEPVEVHVLRVIPSV
jgi:adenylate cyclase